MANCAPYSRSASTPKVKLAAQPPDVTVRTVLLQYQRVQFTQTLITALSEMLSVCLSVCLAVCLAGWLLLLLWQGSSLAATWAT